MKFDELNALSKYVEIPESFYDSLLSLKPKRICDDLLDLLVIAYFSGVAKGNEDLGLDKGIDREELLASVTKEYLGETFQDRIYRYADAKDGNAIVKVASTEIHRVFNDGVYSVGKGENALKTWVTMLDDRVRDTHDYLEGMTLPMDMEFVTYDGDMAMYPGGFNDAANNCGCRCTLKLSW